MLALLKKELRLFFGSFASYFIIGAFLLINTLWLWFFKSDANILNSGFADLSHFFSSTAWLFVLLIPALTMKSFSEEKQLGTLEILKTKPISNIELITGKFLAILVIIITILFPTLCYVYSIHQLAEPSGNIEIGSLIGSYVGLLFLAALFTSIGLWVSSLMKTALMALLGSVTFSFFLFYGIQEFSTLFPSTNLEAIGILSHYTSIARGVIDTRDIIYFVSFSIFFLTCTWYQINLKKEKKKLLYIGLFLIGLFQIGNSIYKRFDLTSDKKYTLSDASIEILQNVKEPLFIKLYLEGKFPPEFKRLQTETAQLLDELKAINKQIKIVWIDPKDQLQQLVKKGLTPSRLTVEENGVVAESIIVPWATIHYNNKTKNIALLKDSSPRESQVNQLESSIQNLEYAFIDGLKKITSKKNKSIAILSGNGELEDLYLYSFLKEIGSTYHLAKFTLDSVATNPASTFEKLASFDLAIIAKPTEKFTEEEKYTLDQYLLQGGKMLWMVDYVVAEMDSLYQTGKTLAYPRDLNLDDFFFRYGARVNPTLIKDLYASKIALATGNTGNKTNYENYLWFYAPLISPHNEHPIIRNIAPVKLSFASNIDTLKNAINKTILLKSSPLSKSINTPTFIELNNVIENPKPVEYTDGHKTAGLLLEGEFTSAYKDRIKPIANFKQALEHGVESKMILIADGDIAKNQIHKGQPLELGIDKWTQEYFGNKAFLLNSIDYLLDDTGLIALRSKTLSLKILNKKKVSLEKTYWQWFNLIAPIFGVLFFGFAYQFFKRRKYSRPLR